jgi:hypothetical protein
MTLAAKLRALADEAEALEARPTQGAPDPAALALWLQPAPHPEESDVEHANRLARRNEGLAAWQRTFDEATFDGPFKVWELTVADMVYIDSVADAYKLKTGRDIMRDGLFAGKNIDLNNVRKNGSAMRGTVDLAAYSSPLKAEVEKRMA